MWIAPRQPRRLYRPVFVLFTSVVCLLYVFRLTPMNVVNLNTSGAELQGLGPAPVMTKFWGDLADALAKAKPDASPIEFEEEDKLERGDFDPLGPGPRMGIDMVKLSKAEILSLTTMHNQFLESVRTLAPALPFEQGTRGIVMTADKSHLGIVVTALLMLRRTGSKLPVQLFLDSSTEQDRQNCDRTVAGLHARCLLIENFLELPANVTKPPKIEKYQFKVFALLFSSFQHILFLDDDAFPIHRPDHLLNVEPYTSFGLVTWPDFWLPTISPLFYKITGLEAQEVTMDSRCTESGIMLFNKAKHADSLLLAVYYNIYGPDLYFPLHSQSAWGQGDKETFRLAANVLRNPMWHIHQAPEMMSPDPVHDGSGIKQVDPEQDFLAYSKTTGGPKAKPRWMFAHTNRVKIDARKLNSTLGEILYKKNDKGKYTRLWGPDSQPLVDAAGYDLEKTIWEELLKANCEKSYLEECDNLRNYYESVFL